MRITPFEGPRPLGGSTGEAPPLLPRPRPHPPTRPLRKAWARPFGTSGILQVPRLSRPESWCFGLQVPSCDGKPALGTCPGQEEDCRGGKELFIGAPVIPN